jgi:hypothetical protein
LNIIIIIITAYSDNIPQVESPEVVEFGKDSIIISFEWIEAHKNGVSYIIDTVPPSNNITYYHAGARVQLQISYNTVYNVSVKPLCGQSDTVTFITLNYSEFHPIKLILQEL